jgi:hypothetical protein
MIQKLVPPPSAQSTPKKPQTAEPARNPAPVNRPVDLNRMPAQMVKPVVKPATRPMAQAEVSVSQNQAQSQHTNTSTHSNPTVNNPALSKYEQTQKFLKDQILSVQRKSKNLKETERKLLYQGLGALGGSFLLCVGFIRFAGNLSSLSLLPQTDKIAPRVPAFAAPDEATQEDTITLNGYAEPKSKVVLVKNGSEDQTITADDSGEFSLEVHLDEGINELSLYSVDEANNESVLSKTYTVNLDRTAPEVDWLLPEENKTVLNLREQTIDVKGKVNERAKVYLNDQFVSYSPDGNFSTTFQLQQGDNKLTLKVIDDAQNETVVERTVSFKP